MKYDLTLPPPGTADVRITAATPDVARKVAQALRAWFASTEQRSFPAGDGSTGTCLHLTVDTRRRPRPVGHTAPESQGRPVTGVRRIW